MNLKNKTFLTYLIIVLIVGLISLLIFVNKSENIPTLILGGITTIFAVLAYFFAQEKFNLDLLEKRWPVYQEILTFNSLILQYGRIPSWKDNPEDRKKIEEAALGSFRGLGYHKMRSLFGKDIEDYCAKLNKIYAWYVPYSSHSDNINAEKAEEYAKERLENLGFLMESVRQLPEIFRPYVYFGNYKLDYK